MPKPPQAPRIIGGYNKFSKFAILPIDKNLSIGYNGGKNDAHETPHRTKRKTRKMIITAEQIHEIAKSVIAKNYDYEYIGLRIQESNYGQEVGDEIEHCSRHWIDGDMTDDEIDGICAVNVAAAAKKVLSFGGYIGTIVIVIGSNRSEYGEDDGEIILQSGWATNPIILDIIIP